MTIEEKLVYHFKVIRKCYEDALVSEAVSKRIVCLGIKPEVMEKLKS